MQAYMDDSGGSHLLIEKFVKIHKCHRNILDQDVAFLDRLVVKIEEHSYDVKEEQWSLAEEKRERSEKVEPHQKEPEKAEPHQNESANN